MKALVVHALREDSRLTNLLHSTCFARHLGGFQVTYANVYGPLKDVVTESKYDIGFVTYEALALRTAPEWLNVRRRIVAALRACEVRALVPQDDYTCARTLDDLACEAGVHFVLSPLTRDLEVLYPKALRAGVRFVEFLTGYWEDSLTATARSLDVPFSQRIRDVGQRVRELPIHFGRHAQIKARLANDFSNEMSRRGFQCDTSSGDRNVLYGFEWWRFLGETRFTIGSKGGASIVDTDGSLARKVQFWTSLAPKISESRLMNLIGLRRMPEYDFAAIGPRFFESAALGVCQVLLQDDYLPNFRQWEHYLPLQADLSNVEEVVQVMRDHDLCEGIASSAREILIESGRYSYATALEGLVHQVLGVNVQGSPLEIIDADAHFFGTSSRVERDEVRNCAQRRLAFGRRATRKVQPVSVNSWIGKFEDQALLPETFLRPWISLSIALDTTNTLV
jgi:hypothetical protein